MGKIRLRFTQQHWCIQCRDWTDHEREETLPAQYRCGDPDYEDRTKCGRCGETYLCDECGTDWDMDAEQCAAVLDHGYHGPQVDRWQVLADDIPWTDGDGVSAWDRAGAESMADHVESLKYRVELVPE